MSTDVVCVTRNLETIPVCLDEKNVSENTCEENSLMSKLKQIKESSQQLSSLKCDIKKYDNYIQQLNLFNNLLIVRENCKNSQRQIVPSKTLVACKCRTFSQPTGYIRNHFLEITLKNSSGISISPDWLITVSVELLKINNQSPSSGNIHNFSCPLLNGLDSDSEFVYTLPLCGSLTEMTSSQSKVTIGLVLRKTDLSSFQTNWNPSCKSARSEVKDLCGGLKVTVFHDIVDYIHFLSLPSGLSVNSLPRTGARDVWLTTELHKLAHRRVCGQHDVTAESSSVNASFAEAKCCIPQIAGET